MEISQILLHASQLVYENVKNMAGTDDAAGDFGTGAGGDISRNIDTVSYTHLTLPTILLV